MFSELYKAVAERHPSHNRQQIHKVLLQDTIYLELMVDGYQPYNSVVKGTEAAWYRIKNCEK